MKTRDLIQIVEADGWYLDRIKGSHHIYKHPAQAGHTEYPGT
jgi:predicted RNA binding protein YcfA (HicA-like mRNA interferase family)